MPGMQVLCPCVQMDSSCRIFKSIIDNYEVLCQKQIESLQDVKDTEIKSRIIEVSTHMEIFHGVTLGELILWHADI